MTTEDRDPDTERHAAAIQCVGELGRGLKFLETEVTSGAPPQMVEETIHQMRVLLSALSGVIGSDGWRWR